MACKCPCLFFMFPEAYCKILQELQFNCVKNYANQEPEWRNVRAISLEATSRQPLSVAMQLPVEMNHTIRFLDRKFRKISKLTLKYARPTIIPIYTESYYNFTHSCRKRDEIFGIKIDKPQFIGDLKTVSRNDLKLKGTKFEQGKRNTFVTYCKVQAMKGEWGNVEYKTVAGIGLAGIDCRLGVVIDTFPLMKTIAMRPVSKPELTLHEESIQSAPKECIISSGALKRVDIVEALHNYGWELIEKPEWKSELCLLELAGKCICIVDLANLQNVEGMKIDVLIVENPTTSWSPNTSQYRSSGVEDTIRIINELTQQ